MRKGAMEHAQDHTRSYRTNPLMGTTDEREAAITSLGEVVTEVKEAVQNYLGECNLHEIDKLLMTETSAKKGKSKALIEHE